MNVRETADRWVMPTYRRQPLTIVRGAGTHVYDEDGREYLDFVAGIAVTAVGHSNPEVAEAFHDQAQRIVHTSNLYYTQPMAELAEKLCSLLGWDDGRVFFCNSGAEANECAIKLARKWSNTHFGPDRYETIAALGSFHGRTLETLAATGQPAKWEGFSPLPPGFLHVPFDDAAALEAAITDRTCSVLLEPVQGEGGVVVPAPGYLPQVRKICDAASLVFIADEVQTGLGRTGEWFAFQSEGAVPDVITLAKALGNGLPIGTCIARGEHATAFKPGDHATTMGGGAAVSAAALKVIEIIERDGLVANSRAMGERLTSGLRALSGRHPVVSEVRGAGLLLAVQLGRDIAGRVVAGALQKGLLVNEVTPSAVRLSPALIVTETEIDRALSILDDVFSEIGEEQ